MDEEGMKKAVDLVSPFVSLTSELLLAVTKISRHNGELKKELQAAKERADRAASERETSVVRQLLKLAKIARNRMIKRFGLAITANLSKEGDIYCMRGVRAVISRALLIKALCAVLEISREDFLSRLGPDLSAKLLNSDRGALLADNYEDLGGILRSDHVCKMRKK